MVWWLKCMPRKCEDQSLAPQSPHKMTSGHVHPPVIPPTRQKWKTSRMENKTSHNVELRASLRGPIWSKVEEGSMKNPDINLRPPHVHAYRCTCTTHVCAHIHANMQTHTHTHENWRKRQCMETLWSLTKLSE